MHNAIHIELAKSLARYQINFSIHTQHEILCSRCESVGNFLKIQQRVPELKKVYDCLLFLPYNRSSNCTYRLGPTHHVLMFWTWRYVFKILQFIIYLSNERGDMRPMLFFKHTATKASITTLYLSTQKSLILNNLPLLSFFRLSLAGLVLPEERLRHKI